MAVNRRTSEIEAQIREELKDIKRTKGVYIVVSNSNEYHTVNKMLIKFITKDMSGIYVTLNVNCEKVVEQLKSENINIEKLSFIDGAEEKGAKHECIMLENSGSLTELSLAITKLLNKGKSDFVFLDSINTLLVYNDMKTVEKFAHFLINKLRSFGVAGIIISVKEKEVNELLPTLHQFCDKCVIFDV